MNHANDRSPHERSDMRVVKTGSDFKNRLNPGYRFAHPGYSRSGLLAERALKRGVFRSVAELEQTIKAYLEATNADPKPFRWTKTANDILASIQRFCRVPSRQTPRMKRI